MSPTDAARLARAPGPPQRTTPAADAKVAWLRRLVAATRCHPRAPALLAGLVGGACSTSSGRADSGHKGGQGRRVRRAGGRGPDAGGGRARRSSTPSSAPQRTRRWTPRSQGTRTARQSTSRSSHPSRSQLRPHTQFTSSSWATAPPTPMGWATTSPSCCWRRRRSHARSARRPSQ